MEELEVPVEQTPARDHPGRRGRLTRLTHTSNKSKFELNTTRGIPIDFRVA